MQLILWLWLGFIFLLVEMLIPGTVLFISLAYGFFCMALCTFIGVLNPLLLILNWAITVTLGFWITSNWLKRSNLSIKEEQLYESNILGLVGQVVTVTRKLEVGSMAEYKVAVGVEEWSAKSLGKDIFSIGESARVIRVVGNTLLIKKL